jgi:pyruvate-ferredoxin/flavodoxin oxidoreductase
MRKNMSTATKVAPTDKSVKTQWATIDGNTAAAHVAYAFSEVAAIYPITPSTLMGELADEWASQDKKNVFGETLSVMEMQSEGGAAGAIHGSLSAGALTTTFTASQGLLLMMPNMFKIAGEMLPTVFHVTARSLACQSLSIFCDHSDVMAVRGTGFAELASNNVQEAHDFAIIAHLATLDSRVPFVHFFDGFRTSNEIQKVELADYEYLKTLVNEEHVQAFRSSGMTPDDPYVKVGAQNPDVYFQGRETVNSYYTALPGIVKKYMDVIYNSFGRRYNLFDYIGAADAEKVIIAIGSATETIEETVNYLTGKGEKVGAVKIHLYRPFSVEDFITVLPSSVKKIAVLDRTKEPGAIGEPLYLDVVAALKDRDITIVGGRYGLSSKEFTPTMVKAVYNHLDGACTHNFTVGIYDDVTNTSLPLNEEIITEDIDTVACKFWGFGSDGTVGANKNSIKIIGDHTDLHAQGYFEYDSKKSGGVTISHLRFGKKPIQSQYLVNNANFVALHKPSYIGKYEILEGIRENGTFLLNAPWSSEEAFNNLTEDMQAAIIDKNIKCYIVDAYKIADDFKMPGLINTIMQTAFFKVSGILPEQDAIQLIKDSIAKTYKRKGEEIIKNNWACVDAACEAIQEIVVPAKITTSAPRQKLIPDDASDFAKDVIEPIMRLKGNTIPVSKMPLDGRVPVGTTSLEKRGIALEVPKWKSENCIQCGSCAFVCPHAAIRTKQISPSDLKNVPEGFTAVKSMTRNDKDLQFKVQNYIDDCTGCGACVEACKEVCKGEAALNMTPYEEAEKCGERDYVNFFENLPDNVVDGIREGTVKGSQYKVPLFEFSGACAGCGETPYVRLVTQLFGDRMVVANATGCSSIYGATFPTTPYCANKEGKGPVWANSLFEDNAEYGLGMRLALDANRKQLRSNIDSILAQGIISDALKDALNGAIGFWDAVTVEAQKHADATKTLITKEKATASGDVKATLGKISELQDYLIEKSLWIIGGDGWAYDIGYGGLDHVLASGKNVNVLVLDTEVYSNTGGQASKATPRGAVAKFAASGKKLGKKNLGLMMRSYGNVYVASVNMGANKAQLLKALLEAEKYDGPSIVIAYTPCIAHGINMRYTQQEEKLAADVGYWPLYRYNPSLEEEGKDPLSWDSKDSTKEFDEYTSSENRYKVLTNIDAKEAERLRDLALGDNKRRFEDLKKS